MIETIVFDVNETLLDLAALEPRFVRVFGEGGARQEWFKQMIHSALVSTVTGPYVNFGEIGGAALEAVAARYHVTLDEDDKVEILTGMRTLPPHPEVAGALARLQAAGLRLAALTNSTLEVGQAQLSYAGLAQHFEQILSADTVHRLKPAPEPYQMAADRLGVAMDNVRLVAAHGWDIAGALRGGCAAAFVARPGKQLDPLAPQPDIVGDDLQQVGEQIIGHDAPGSR